MEQNTMTLIKKMVTPDSWEDVGGPGQIAAVPKHSSLFAIRQTFEIHEEIEEFLHTLNKAKEATKK